MIVWREMDIDLAMCSKQRMFDMGVVLCFKHLVEIKGSKIVFGVLAVK